VKIIVGFDEPLTQVGVDAFTELLEEEIKRWGGFHGHSIGDISIERFNDTEDQLHVSLSYFGGEAGQGEIFDAFWRELAERKTWGVGSSHVCNIGRMP
jgi:hypothetical protein